MMARKFPSQTRVVVGNLLRLPSFNRLALEAYQPDKPSPQFLSPQQLLGRTLGAEGTVEGAAPGRTNDGVFVVRHDDGTTALYHCSELVTADRFAEQQAAGEHKFTPLVRSVLRGIAFEIYEGIDPTRLPCDHLIVPVDGILSTDALDYAPLHRAVAQASSGSYRQQLEAAGKLERLQTVITRADGTPFGAVLFINGIRPTMDAIDKTLRDAQRDGARTIVLPLRQFEMQDGLEDDLHYDDLLHMLDVMAEVADVSFETIKIAL